MRTLVTVTLLGLAVSLTAASPKSTVNTSSGNLALRGYDAVAYSAEGRAVPGVATYETTWNGARWRFASAANRDAFLQSPGKYAPQFGGYCAWAVAHGHTADGDPQVWKIVGGKLYLNYSKGVQRMWEQNIPEYIKQAEGNWPTVLGK